MLSKEDINQIKLMIEEIVPPMLRLSEQRTINKLRAEIRLLNSELYKKLHSEFSIEIGRIWEELKDLRMLLETHIELHNGTS